MKRALLLATLLPIVAYSPFFMGGILPVWLNLVLFVGAIVAALMLTSWWSFRTPIQRKASQVMRWAGILLYLIIVVGLVDVVMLASGASSAVIVGGEGWGDLIAFVTWAIFIIPAAYIVGTALIFIAHRINRPVSVKEPT
jgi:hypothetical protein